MKTNKFVALSCATLLSASLFVGCASTGSSASSSNASESEQAQDLSGGWTNNAVISEVVSKEDQDRFVKAGAQKELVPVAVLGRQLVSGMNYAYLCWDGTNWYVQVVYEDLQGAVSLGSQRPISVTNISTTAASGEQLSGAWTTVVNRDTSKLKPAEPFLALSAAALEAKQDLLPTALLATQVVSGTNYRFICGVPKDEKSDEGALYIVDVYEDLQGKATITSQELFDLTAYVG